MSFGYKIYYGKRFVPVNRMKIPPVARARLDRDTLGHTFGEETTPRPSILYLFPPASLSLFSHHQPWGAPAPSSLIPLLSLLTLPYLKCLRVTYAARPAAKGVRLVLFVHYSKDCSYNATVHKGGLGPRLALAPPLLVAMAACPAARDVVTAAVVALFFAGKG